MKRRIHVFCWAGLCLAAISWPATFAEAGGFKGGGRGGGMSRGGGAARGGAAARPASMPHMGGGARPAMPTQRPSVSRPSVSPRPSQRPSMPSTRPSMPTTRPSLPNTRPNVPTTRPSTRPSVPSTRPSLPSGGLKPSWPPTANRPSTLPGNLPNRPANGGNRPTTLPGNLPSRPGTGGDRPGTLPSRPGTGGGRPSTLPGNLPNRPGNGGERPGTLPNRPGTGGDRPTTLPSNRPGSRPSLPNMGGGRPATLPGHGRPSAGDLGDFLGIDGGLRPDQPGRFPGLGNRPARPGNTPGIVNRPANRPSTLPVGIPPRPGANKRPINIGNIHVGNTVINNRPTWANINSRELTTINNRMRTQVGSLQGWNTRYPARIGYWNHWGGSVRTRWNGYHYHNHWFTGNWWIAHPAGVCSWHYYHRFNSYPWNYWWRRPAWPATAAWFTWSAPPTVWAEPAYYDYGSGGNVTYENNNVYINGSEVATAVQFAQSAADLATVAPPANDAQAEQAEWLPLGTFALSTAESDVEPTRIVQLAVDKTGIIAGTMVNRDTDQADAIQGQVDKDTQRVAFRIGESDTVVAETGLYNLTQDEAPLLVHFGTERTEDYLLVRLDAPDEPSEDDSSAAASSGK